MTYDLHDVYNDLENTVEELKVELKDLQHPSDEWQRTQAKIGLAQQKKILIGYWIKENLIAYQNREQK